MRRLVLTHGGAAPERLSVPLSGLGVTMCFPSETRWPDRRTVPYRTALPGERLQLAVLPVDFLS